MESPGSKRVEMPTAFEDSDIDHLAILIADMLERLMMHNDRIPLTPESLTRFHSRSTPNISVLDYLRRIIRFANVEKACLLITLHYADQIWARTRLVTLTSLTCHRFVITSITVSSKALCDVFCTNTLYAKVGGIPVTELNTLEREFLGLIDWRVMCTRETLQEYYINLVRTSKDYVLAKEESSSSSNGASSSDSDDVDMDSGQSNPPSPSDQSSRTHRRRPSAYEASTILVDPDSNPQEVSRRPTIEQNMAFAELQQMGGPGIGGSNKFKHPGNS